MNRQWRIAFTRNENALVSCVCFVDAATEISAREFFEKSFPPPRFTLVSIKLEETNPCAQYERKPV